MVPSITMDIVGCIGYKALHCSRSNIMLQICCVRVPLADKLGPKQGVRLCAMFLKCSSAYSHHGVTTHVPLLFLFEDRIWIWICFYSLPAKLVLVFMTLFSASSFPLQNGWMLDNHLIGASLLSGWRYVKGWCRKFSCERASQRHHEEALKGEWDIELCRIRSGPL